MTSLEATQYVNIKVEDRPGMLAEIARGLKWRNISLRGLWGFATNTGEVHLFCVSNDLQALKEFLLHENYSFQEGRAVYVYGPDETGSLVEMLEKLAGAGLNIRAMETVAAGNQFAAYLWFEEKEEEKAFRTLGLVPWLTPDPVGRRACISHHSRNEDTRVKRRKGRPDKEQRLLRKVPPVSSRQPPGRRR